MSAQPGRPEAYLLGRGAAHSSLHAQRDIQRREALVAGGTMVARTLIRKRTMCCDHRASGLPLVARSSPTPTIHLIVAWFPRTLLQQAFLQTFAQFSPGTTGNLFNLIQCR